jgi:hypothetical protein
MVDARRTVEAVWRISRRSSSPASRGLAALDRVAAIAPYDA